MNTRIITQTPGRSMMLLALFATEELWRSTYSRFGTPHDSRLRLVLRRPTLLSQLRFREIEPSDHPMQCSRPREIQPRDAAPDITT